jgi:pimeloyl-ACP methyl ester carboxylesterase
VKRSRAVALFRAFVVLLTVMGTGALAAAQPERAGRTTNGIAFDVQGTGPAVVLITGSNLDRRMWAREAGWLASDHTVIRYDLRAHGASDAATRPFRHIDDLFTLLDETGIRSATLIGLSAGAEIALDAALAEPSRVDRLVLVGPAVSGFRSESQLPFAGALVAALQARDYAKAGEVLLGSSVFEVPGESQALVREMVIDNNRLWSTPREMVLQLERPAIDRLNEVTLPTLIMLGEQDRFQRGQAELLARRIPGARLVIIPGGGHLLNLTSPEEFRAEVSQFVQQRIRSFRSSVS